MTIEELKQLARQMQERAYCPYSHFPVGAVLECTDGSVYTGCNIENSSYPAGSCAERVAVSKAVSEGNTSFRRIVIVANTDDICVPCGMCRQFMQEFSPNLEVICMNAKGETKAYFLSELLPYQFDGSCLR
ncbi:MAG: cytidine deaminase [Proteobacteria bacterium]|nr:cytidine deaminase [Pseudomonadota bacterium]